MIKLTYNGHSCFTMTLDGYSVVLDPYDTTVPGYKPLALQANEIFCSHEHFDHNYREAVAIIDAPEKPDFKITEIHSFHDPEGGTLRGTNIIRVFEYDGLRIAHFGDIGCIPTEEQKKLLTGLDIAMIPVGGTFTLDASEERDLMAQLGPKAIIPMHYRLDGFGFDVLTSLYDFTALYDEASVHMLGTPTMELTKGLQGIFVLGIGQ